MPLLPEAKNCDPSVKKNFRRVSAKLGYTAIPSFASITLTDLTASTLVGANASKTLESVTIGTGLDYTRPTLSLSHLGIEALTDPGADRIFFWDNSASASEWLAVGNSIAITTTTIDTIQDIRTSASPTFAGLTVTNSCVLGSDSAVFQPTTDSTTFFQVLDADGGVPVLNVDTTNERVGIGTIPESTLHLEADYVPTASASVNSPGIVFTDSVTGSHKSGIIPTQDARDIDFFVSTGGVIRLRGDTEIIDNSFRAMSVADYHWLDLENTGSICNIYTYTWTGSSNPPDPIAFGFVDGRGGGIGSGEIMRLLTNGNIGIGETLPETLTEWTSTVPYLTLHNSTHEDTDGGGESRLIFKREDGSGNETAAFQFEASHEGVVADDQLAKGVWSVNTGSGLVEVMRINSSGYLGVGTASQVSLLEADGALGLAIETVTGNTTLDATHSTVLVNASGNVTITLPAAASAYNSTDGIGRIYEIKKIDVDADTVTIDGNGSETIDGGTTAVLTIQYESITIQSDGSNWHII